MAFVGLWPPKLRTVSRAWGFIVWPIKWALFDPRLELGSKFTSHQLRAWLDFRWPNSVIWVREAAWLYSQRYGHQDLPCQIAAASDSAETAVHSFHFYRTTSLQTLTLSCRDKFFLLSLNSDWSVFQKQAFSAELFIEKLDCDRVGAYCVSGSIF